MLMNSSLWLNFGATRMHSEGTVYWKMKLS